MAITKIQSNAFPASIDLSNIDLTIGANEIVTANIADNNVTHAKLHTDMDLTSKTVTLPALTQNFVVNGQIQSNVTGGGLYTSTAGGIPRLYLGGGSGFGINRQSSSEDIFFGEPGDTGTWRVRGAGTISLGVGNSDTTVTIQGNGGNVGIGVATPSNRLEVDGGSASTRLRVSTTNTGSNVAGIILANSSKTAYNDGIEIVHGGGFTNFRDLAGTNQLTLNVTTGRFGVGTDPGYKLHVDAAGDNAVAKFAGGANSYIDFFESGSSINLRIQSSGQCFIRTTTAHDIGFGTNSTTDQLYLQNGGEVGIGTNSPSRALHIKASNSPIRIENTGSGKSGIEIYNGDTKKADITWNEGSANLEISNYRNDSQSGGPYANIDFFTGGPDATSPNYSPLRRMRIQQTGEVGIGTDDPQYKLDVNGDIRSTAQYLVSTDVGQLDSGASVDISSANRRNAHAAQWSFSTLGDNNWRTLFSYANDSYGILTISGSDAAVFDIKEWGVNIASPAYGVANITNTIATDGAWPSGSFDVQLINAGNNTYAIQFKFSSYYSASNRAGFTATWRRVR